MPVIMGLDYGTRRIGIAVSDAEGRMAFAIGTHTEGRDGSVLACLAALVAERGVSEVVVGLPLTADGRETEIAARARRFAGVVGEALALPVHLLDERYSSQQAERILVGRGRTREDVDALAAEIVLQSFLDARQRAQEPK
jgi:putative Holliday junction resolvase